MKDNSIFTEFDLGALSVNGYFLLSDSDVDKLTCLMSCGLMRRFIYFDNDLSMMICTFAVPESDFLNNYTMYEVFEKMIL